MAMGASSFAIPQRTGDNQKVALLYPTAQDIPKRTDDNQEVALQ